MELESIFENILISENSVIKTMIVTTFCFNAIKGILSNNVIKTYNKVDLTNFYMVLLSTKNKVNMKFLHTIIK